MGERFRRCLRVPQRDRTESCGVESPCLLKNHHSFKIYRPGTLTPVISALTTPGTYLAAICRMFLKMDGIDSQQQVYEQRPFAFLQIILAIFAVEVYGNRKQEENPMGGDLGFDPLGLRPSEQEAWERVQLRELKNGRLAMFAILGMIVQEHITGVGVFGEGRRPLDLGLNLTSKREALVFLLFKSYAVIQHMM